MKTLKQHLEQLFEECKHGDEQHQQWLKDKFNSYLESVKEGELSSAHISDTMEAAFVEKLIEELPNHGVDTSQWEYKYGDCCDDAVEFLARAIKGGNT